MYLFSPTRKLLLHFRHTDFSVIGTSKMTCLTMKKRSPLTGAVPSVPHLYRYRHQVEKSTFQYRFVENVWLQIDWQCDYTITARSWEFWKAAMERFNSPLFLFQDVNNASRQRLSVCMVNCYNLSSTPKTFLHFAHSIESNAREQNNCLVGRTLRTQRFAKSHQLAGVLASQFIDPPTIHCIMQTVQVAIRCQL